MAVYRLLCGRGVAASCVRVWWHAHTARRRALLTRCALATRGISASADNTTTQVTREAYAMRAPATASPAPRCNSSSSSSSATVSDRPDEKEDESHAAYLHHAAMALLLHILPSPHTSHASGPPSRYLAVPDALQRMQAHVRRTLSSRNRVQHFVHELTPDTLTALIQRQLSQGESPPPLWLQRGGGAAAVYDCVARRADGEYAAPAVRATAACLAGEGGEDDGAAAPPSRRAHHADTRSNKDSTTREPNEAAEISKRRPCVSPEGGGQPVALADASAWRSPQAVPTPADVYEILKYIPVNWGNMGLLQIPAEVRRRHIRIASILMWFRRQPHFFELRNMNGTVEIRRSVVLHPAAHKLTPAAAAAQLEQSIRSGAANRLVLLDCHGQPCAAGGGEGVAGASESVSFSPVAQYMLRFLTRTCPGYFVPLGIIFPRYIKKNITVEALAQLAAQHPARFETLRLRYSDGVWVRQRIGADSARWGRDFVRDLECEPGDVAALVVVCEHLCTLWDRPAYVYARLSPLQRRVVPSLGYMTAMMRRHPRVFRVGRVFVSRVDWSDPVSQSTAEPAEGDCLSCAYNSPINPYLSAEEVVKVFYHVAPPHTSCTVAFFVACASPAMQGALPPRVISLIQLFPAWFACQEVTPGVFTVRKLSQPPQSHTSEHDASAEGVPRGGGADGDTAAGDDVSAASEAEMLAGEELTREGALAAMKELVPVDGVDVTHLLLWASMALQRVAVVYYGSVVRMLETEKEHFRVVENERTKMVYLRHPTTPAATTTTTGAIGSDTSSS